MSENIENYEDLETIPTDNTTEEVQENVEQSTGEVSGEVSGEVIEPEVIEVPEDNSAKIEAEQERLRREHEEYLNSFPETTVFYRDLLVDGNIKKLGMATKDPHVADYYKILDNHFDESELTYIGTADCGIYYLKDYAPETETEEQKRARIFESKKIEISDAVQRVIDETAHKRGYDTGVSLMSYATSNNARYHADAVEFSDWRDSVWDTAHDVENKVLAGELDIDDVSVEYVLERLPVLEW